MKIFQRGETIEIIIHIYNYDDNLVPQDSATITINDSDKNEILMALMDNDDIGIYSYNHTLITNSKLGTYTIKIITKSGLNYTISNYFFKVITAI